MWAKVRCSQCVCNERREYVWKPKKWIWHKCKFDNYERYSKAEVFNTNIVQNVRKLGGMIPLGDLNKKQLNQLKTACKLEALARNEVCEKGTAIEAPDWDSDID